MPKHFLNSSTKTTKTVQKTSFFIPKIVKNYLSKPSKSANFSLKISFFGVINQSLELKIHPIVALLSSKTSHKLFLNNSKKLWKSSGNDFFGPQNSKITDVYQTKSVDFWVYFRHMTSIFGFLLNNYGFLRISPPPPLNNFTQKKKSSIITDKTRFVKEFSIFLGPFFSGFSPKTQHFR